MIVQFDSFLGTRRMPQVLISEATEIEASAKKGGWNCGHAKYYQFKLFALAVTSTGILICGYNKADSLGYISLENIVRIDINKCQAPIHVMNMNLSALLINAAEDKQAGWDFVLFYQSDAGYVKEFSANHGSLEYITSLQNEIDERLTFLRILILRANESGHDD